MCLVGPIPLYRTVLFDVMLPLLGAHTKRSYEPATPREMRGEWIRQKVETHSTLNHEEALIGGSLVFLGLGDIGKR